jgi:hypothetical protein
MESDDEIDALIAKLYALGWTTGGVAYQQSGASLGRCK